ncbi:unnamed protein product [Orchesella dallaii]|uniref:Uncharacterized protein n=1 Tax=Orchesella dallaii TaxID=48710 RepID=A0ABP1QNB7_9HEXA
MGSDILKGMIALANKLVPLKEEEECNSLKILGDFMGINETNRSEIMKVAGFTEMLIEKFDKIDIFKAEKEEMLINLMKILWQVTCEDKSFMEKLFPEDNAMIQKMFTLVTHHNFKVFNPAVQLFRKLSAGTDEQTKRVLKLGIIHRLPLVLVKPGADIFVRRHFQPPINLSTT